MHLMIHTVVKPLIVGGLLTLLPLTAQGPRHEGGPRHEDGSGPGHFFFRGLDLTESQKANLKAIGEKHKANFETKRKATQEAQDAFQKAMKDPASKEADLKTLHTKLADTRFAEMLERRAMMQESLGVLTPEQKTQFEKKLAEGPRHEGRPGQKGGHKGGPDHEEGPRPE